MDLTIIIPIIDHPEFLARALKYYKLVKFDGPIFIGDSCKDDEWHKNKNLIASTKELDLHHYRFPVPPYLHSGMCVRMMNMDILTKYAVFQGNDDFFILSGLQQCIDFLEQSSDDFVAAHGRRCAVKIVDDKPYGKINGIVKPCFGQEWLDNDPSHRWQKYIRRSYSNQFSVHRTNIWQKMHAKVNLIPSRYLGGEFLPCSLNAILGKTKQLDCAYGVRQNYNTLRQDKLFEDIHVDNWASSLRDIEKILIDNNIPSDVVHSYLWFHIGFALISQYSRYYFAEEINDIRAEVGSEWSYYKDFAPIFDFLTE